MPNEHTHKVAEILDRLDRRLEKMEELMYPEQAAFRKKWKKITDVASRTKKPRT